MGKEEQIINDKLNKAVSEGVIASFNEILDLDIKQGSMETAMGINEFQKNVASVIAFYGDIKGLFILKCSKDLEVAMVYNMYKNLVGSVPEKMSVKEIHDGIGEILNTICGKIKQYYAKEINPFSISTPTISYGNDVNLIIKDDEDHYSTTIIYETTITKFNKPEKEVFYFQIYLNK